MRDGAHLNAGECGGTRERKDADDGPHRYKERGDVELSLKTRSKSCFFLLVVKAARQRIPELSREIWTSNLEELLHLTVTRFEVMS